MDSVLRPRDIQARIRAGEAPEDVAAAAQTTVDKIMGFATPVLAERAYQAQLAQRASVRRRAATGHVGNLGSAVTTHLETLDVDPESVEWDAWRREDGRWTVVAGYLARGEHRQAAFTYDTAGRFVVADDEEARSLVGERAAVAQAQVTEAPAPGLAAVSTDTVDAPADLLIPREVERSHESPTDAPESGEDQTALGDDAIHLVTGRRLDPPPAPPEGVTDLEGEVTVDLTDTSAAVRGSRGPTTADADWITTQASERPTVPPPPVAGPTDPVGEPVGGSASAEDAPTPRSPEPDAPPPDGGRRADPWDTPGRDDAVEGDAREEEQEATEALFEVPAAAKRPTRSSRSRGRAPVPSWDEIMFGGPKSE